MRGIADLKENEFLYETRLFPDLEYTFKHALTHETTYNSMLAERRRSLHRRIVEIIERLYPERRSEQIERLAHHALRGELWEQAVGCYEEAARKSMARSAYNGAVAGLEHALVALGHQPESRETLQRGIDLRFELRSSLQALGQHQRIFEHLREAEALASTLGDRGRLGWASAYLSQYFSCLGNATSAVERGHRAQEIAKEFDNPSLHAAATFFLGQGHYNVGDYPRAIAYLRENIALIQGDALYERHGLTSLASVVSRIWLGWALAECGAFSEAIAQVKDGLSIAETADQPYSIAAAWLGLGQIHLLQGDLAGAAVALERCATISETWHLSLILPAALALLGLATALTAADSDMPAETGHNDSDTLSIQIFDSPTIATAPETRYFLTGRLDEAERTAIRTLAVAQERGFRGIEARAKALLGEIAAEREPPAAAQAMAQLESARTLAQELDMRPLVAHCHAALGRLLRRLGRHDEADGHRTAAMDLYRELGMDSWLERARAEAAPREPA
ncbi:MAG TPA: hypothetical protein VLL72_05460 [Kiloniellales bacterium]|nr:hypothetical protein [Kiloniellales bacterium]